jgi:hypothetical protein
VGRRGQRNPRTRLAAADTARRSVLGRPNSAAVQPPCVLAPLDPALARPRTRASLTPPRESGQATVESLAAVPLLLLVGVVALQLLVAGCALSLADGAAEAGALALAGGRPARAAALEALPGWARDRASVSVHGGEVSVRLPPPSLLPVISEALVMSSSAFARGAEP